MPISAIGKSQARSAESYFQAAKPHFRPPTTTICCAGDLLRAICSCHLRDLNRLDRNRMAMESFSAEHEHPVKRSLCAWKVILGTLMQV